MGSPKQLLINRLAKDYAKANVIAKETAEGLLSRLSLMRGELKTILDLKAGGKEMTAGLVAQYPDSLIVAMDPLFSLAQFAKTGESVNWVIAESDMTLPFPDASFDLITANLVLPWCDDVNAVLSEWCRVLKPHGLLLLSSLGPDTLREIKTDLNLNLIDMHDIGDALIQNGLSDPVIESDRLMVKYSNHDLLLRELQATGMLPLDAHLSDNLQENLLINYEVIYAHAWLSPHHKADESGEVRIPLSHLLRR